MSTPNHTFVFFQGCVQGHPWRTLSGFLTISKISCKVHQGPILIIVAFIWIVKTPQIHKRSTFAGHKGYGLIVSSQTCMWIFNTCELVSEFVSFWCHFTELAAEFCLSLAKRCDLILKCCQVCLGCCQLSTHGYLWDRIKTTKQLNYLLNSFELSLLI